VSSAAGAAAITAAGLSKGFDGAQILDSVELTAPGGTVAVVIGPPGSGRSTLARCLTGVYRPDAGDVTFRLGGRGAVNLSAADPRTVAWMRGQHIASFDGLLAAAPRLPAALAVARAARRSRASAVGALTRLQVANLAPVAIGRLRPGERLTVALAAALLAERPFVVLDDPERYADPQTLTAWLRRVSDAGAAVVATAGPGSALVSIATTIGELQRGRLEWHRP
jgi:ABC-type cobalamin/Fe3+-siderophores transport system ATPase subunit